MPLLLGALLVHFSQQVPQQVPQPKPAPRPSVVLIVLDDVGAFDFEHVETPNLHALARAGLEFRRAYAMPTCASARSSLFFGTYGRYSGNTCEPPGPETPDVTRFSLPKAFELRGYATLFTGKWHLGTNRLGRPWEETPRLHGFDEVRAGMPQNLADPCDHPGQTSYERWVRFDRGPSFVEERYNTSVLAEEFRTWWNATRGPRFGLLSFQAAHAPFHDPPPELVPHEPTTPGLSANRRRFERMLIALDTVLADVLATLDLGRDYVIVVGDNGTPPNASAPTQVSQKLKGSVFEGGIRVPFLVAGPGIAPGTSDALVDLVDVLPTVCSLLRLPAPAELDGRSLVPLFRDPAARVHEHVFAADRVTRDLREERHRAVVGERFKLRRVDQLEEFYDLALDPKENAPLSAAALDPRVVAALRAEMSVYLARGF